MKTEKINKIKKTYWNMLMLLTPSEIYSNIFDLKFEENAVILRNPQGKFTLWPDWKEVLNNSYINIKDDTIKYSVGDSNLVFNVIKIINKDLLIINTEWTPQTMKIIKDYTQKELLLITLKFFRNILLKNNLINNIIRTKTTKLNAEEIKYLLKINNQLINTCDAWRWLMIDFNDIPQYLNLILKQTKPLTGIPIEQTNRLNCNNIEFVIKTDDTTKTFHNEILTSLDNIVKLAIQKRIYDTTGIKINPPILSE